MYDFNLLKKTRVESSFKKMPFLDKQRNIFQTLKPYSGLNILHNIPLTFSTIFKIEALALAGAQIAVISPTGFPFDKKAYELLINAGFEVSLQHNFNQTFDIHLDCCANLINLPPPKLGAVELTQSGSHIYQSTAINYPVISVDDSKLKVLETYFGTGDGFSRALYQLVGEERNNKPFVIFGHGKVGKGILYAVRQFSNNITVIDLPQKLTNEPLVNYIDAKDKLKIKEIIKNSYCCITATGKKDLITNFYDFNKADFGNAILINMGAEDEYGANFSLDEIIFKKQPFNFSLTEPTAMRYLDPIFYAHNLSIDFLLDNHANKRYNPFPSNVATDILNEWQMIYNEPLNDALLSF